MRRARRNSLLALTVVATVAAQSARPPGEDAARHEMEQADKARAAELAAQQAAAARAAAAAIEAQRLASTSVVAAARLRQAEQATSEVAARMDRLAEQRRQAQAALDARAEEMQPLLPLIERLSLYPAETLLAVPSSPEETLRGVLVLRGLARQLGQEAVELRRQQARLDEASQALAAEAPKLAAALAQQRAQAAELDRQMANIVAGQHEAETQVAAAAQRAAELAARTDSLRGMLAELEAQRAAAEARARADAARAEKQKQLAEAAAARQRQVSLQHPAGPDSIPTAAQPRGQLTAPVAGTIIRSWGEQTDGGPASGVSYRTPPAARVVSPCTGRVAFAAPFRSYGLLLIVDCGGGYHAVLAGFERLETKVGQPVLAGEPVGVMPSWEPGSSGPRPALYVELRHDGQAINPAPWLRASG